MSEGAHLGMAISPGSNEQLLCKLSSYAADYADDAMCILHCPDMEHQASICMCRLLEDAKAEATHRSLNKEVQGEDADAGGQKAAPEHGGGVERGSLLYGEQQSSNGGCKCRRHTCNTGPLRL